MAAAPCKWRIEEAFGKMQALLGLGTQRGSHPRVPPRARTKLLFLKHYHKLKSGAATRAEWMFMMLCSSETSGSQAVWLWLWL